MLKIFPQDAYNPVGNQLRQDKFQPPHRRDVHGFYSPCFFLADQVEGGQEAADDDEQHDHEGGYHVVAEVERRVVEVHRAVRCRLGQADTGFRLPLRKSVGYGQRGILRPQCSFSGVYSVGPQVQLRPSAVGQVLRVIFRNGDQHIRLACFYLPEGFVVTGVAARHRQVFGGIHVGYQAP